MPIAVGIRLIVSAVPWYAIRAYLSRVYLCNIVEYDKACDLYDIPDLGIHLLALKQLLMYHQ